MPTMPTMPTTLSRLTSSLTRVLALAVAVALIGAGCSDSGDAGEVITSQQPQPTATALTLGRPTATAVTGVTTSSTGSSGDTTTTGSTTTDTTSDVPPTPTLVAAPTVEVILADAAFTASSKVSTVGVDEVFFGMTPDQAATAASTSWDGMPNSAAWPNCFVVTPSNGPDGVSFWVFNRTVERANISHTAVRTRSGFGVGTQLSELQQALGAQLEVTDFGNGQQTAVFVPQDEQDAAFRLIFEVSDGEVIRFRSGRVGVVELPDTSCT